MRTRTILPAALLAAGVLLTWPVQAAAQASPAKDDITPNIQVYISAYNYKYIIITPLVQS